MNREAVSSHPSESRVPLRAWLALVVTIVLWASAFPVIRAGLREFSPGALALYRFLAASAALAVYALAVRLPLPGRRDAGRLLALGLCGITFYHVGLNYGAVTVPAGPAALLINTAPIFTALLAGPVLGERLRPAGWLGIGVGFCGAAILAAGRGGAFRMEPGALLVLACSGAAAAYFLLQKPYIRRYGALAQATHTIWVGTLPMLVFAPALSREWGAVSTRAHAAAIYLGVFPAALAYVTWSLVMQHVRASLAASFMYLVAPLAFLMAWAWLGEVPSAASLAGGALALGGVAIVNRWGKA